MVPLNRQIRFTAHVHLSLWLQLSLSMLFYLIFSESQTTKVVLISKCVTNETGAPKMVPNWLKCNPLKYLLDRLIFRVGSMTLNFLMGDCVARSFIIPGFFVWFAFCECLLTDCMN